MSTPTPPPPNTPPSSTGRPIPTNPPVDAAPVLSQSDRPISRLEVAELLLELTDMVLELAQQTRNGSIVSNFDILDRLQKALDHQKAFVEGA